MLFFLVAVTATPSLGADQMVKLIDVRNASDAANASHYIVICARPQELTREEAQKLPDYSPGHVWVLFAKEDSNAKACVMDKSYGFWPADGVGKLDKLTENVPSKIIDGLTDQKQRMQELKLTHRIILRVSASQYKDALAVANAWIDRKPEYNTLAMNCTHFSMAILENISLRLERKEGEMPTDYLERAASALGQKYGPAR
jgi:hypothetical protein